MAAPEFYSRELWQHSPVYNSFAKLFIKDIHSLRHIPREGPPPRRPSILNILDGADSVRFWLNHPIRWVQVVGIIVALTQKEKIDVILRSNPNR
jgi:Telomere regulation protein Stn1